MRTRAPQRGAAAVELALLLWTLLLMLALAFMGGRVLHNYSVLKEATHNAALYVSSAPPVAMRSAAGAAVYTDRANEIFRATLADSGLKPDTNLYLSILCDTHQCGSYVPETVTADAIYNMDASVLGLFFSDWLSGDLLGRLQAKSTVAYVN